jgi:predicted MFS family arabinose efflux permease
MMKAEGSPGQLRGRYAGEMNPWRGLGGLPREVWLICGSTLVNRLGTMALPFLVLYLTEGRRWRPEEAGAAMLVYGAGALVTGPLAGRLADRLGHLRVLLASLWTSGALLMLLPFATHRVVLYPLIFLWAALTQAFWPSAMALLASVSDPERRKAVYSLHRLAVNLGMSVGPALGGFIAHRSYTWVFWVDGLTTLASAVILQLCLRSRPVAQASGERVSLRAWRDRRLIFLLLGFIPVMMVFFQVEGAMPLWVVRDLRLGNPFFGMIFTVNTLIILALEVPLNLRMAHWPHGRQLLAGALCYAVGFGITGWATTRGLLVGTVVVWTFGEMILLPAASDAVAALAPPERRGEYLGLYSTAFAAALMLGPWLGVMIYARFGSWLWAGCFLAAGLGGLALSRFRAEAAGGRALSEMRDPTAGSL